MLAWLSVWSEVQTCIASGKSRLVLPFWYRLSRVVPEKGPLNVCVCVCVCVCVVMVMSCLYVVAEPFDRSNTARSVYDVFTFQRILRVFRRSHEEMSRTRDVNVILSTTM